MNSRNDFIDTDEKIDIAEVRLKTNINGELTRAEIREIGTWFKMHVIWAFLFESRKEYLLAKKVRAYNKEVKDVTGKTVEKFSGNKFQESTEELSVIDIITKLNPDLRITNFRDGTVFTTCKYFSNLFGKDGKDFEKFLICADAVERLRQNDPSVYEFTDSWEKLASYCGGDIDRLLEKLR